MYIDEEDSSDDEEINSRILNHLKGWGDKLWPSSSIAKLQQTTTYLAARAWYWRKSSEEFEAEFVDDADDGTF